MNEPEDKSVKDTPPLFSTWRRWYLLVLVALFVQIVLYYWLTSLYS